MKKIFTLLLLCTATITLASAKSNDSTRMDRNIEKITFMNKGQWFFGGTASYMSLTSDDYKLLILNNATANAYAFSIKAFAGTCIAPDIAVGLGFDYTRNMVNIPNLDIEFSEDINLGIQDYYSIQQLYSGTAFLRTYINLGNSRRFGLFNDVKISVGGGQGKIISGTGEMLEGTYQKVFKAGIIIQPGVTVFITNFFAVEASIGLLGLQYSRTEQVTNQVYQGSVQTWDANFKVNLFSINLGMSLYF